MVQWALLRLRATLALKTPGPHLALFFPHPWMGSSVDDPGAGGRGATRFYRISKRAIFDSYLKLRIRDLIRSDIPGAGTRGYTDKSGCRSRKPAPLSELQEMTLWKYANTQWALYPNGGCISTGGAVLPAWFLTAPFIRLTLMPVTHLPFG